MATNLNVGANTTPAQQAFNALAASINNARGAFNALANSSAVGSFNNMANSLRGLNNLVGGFDTIVADASRSASRFGSAIGSGLSGAFDTLYTAVSRAYSIIRNVAAGVEFVFSALLKELDKLQGFAAVMSVTEKSSSSAAVAYEFLRKTADKLGVQFDSLASNYAKLVAAIPEGADRMRIAENVFTGIAMAARTLHSSAQDTQLMFYAVTQMASKGAVSMEELRRQLGEKLPGTMQIAARSVNATTDQLEQAIRKGAVNSEKFLKAFGDELIRTFAGSAELASESVSASINRLINVWTDFTKAVIDSGAARTIAGFFDAIREKLSDPYVISRFAETIDQLAKKLTDMVQNLTADDIRNGFDTFSKGLNLIIDLVAKAISGFQWMMDNLPKVGFWIGAVGGGLVGLQAGPVGALVGASLGGVGGYAAGRSLSPTKNDIEARRTADDWARKQAEDAASSQESIRMITLPALLTQFKGLNGVRGIENLFKSDMANSRTLEDLTKILYNPAFKSDAARAQAVKDYSMSGRILTPSDTTLADVMQPGKAKRGRDREADKLHDTYMRGMGFDPKFFEEWNRINDLKEQGLYTDRQANEAHDQLLAKQPIMQKELKEENKIIKQGLTYREQILSNILKYDDVNAALNDQFKEDMRIASMRKEDAEIENSLKEMGLKFDREGLSMTASQRDAMRDKLRALQEARQISEAESEVINTVVDAYQRELLIVKAIERAQSDVKTGLTLTKSQDYIASKTPGVEGTQQWVDAQTRALEEYYSYIKLLRNRNLLSEEAAQQAMTTRAVETQQKLKDAYLKAAEVRLAADQSNWADAILIGLSKVADGFTSMALSVAGIMGNLFTRLADGFADSIGRAIVYSENLGDSLKNVAKDAIAQLITALIKLGLQIAASELMTVFFGAPAANISGGAGGGSLFGQASGAASIWNAGSGAYNYFGGGGAATTYSSFATSAVGQKLGLSTLAEDAAGNMYLSTASQGGTLSTIGSTAASVGGVAAGIYGGRAISGGYSAIGGGSGNSAVNIGTTIGEVIGLWLGIPGVGGAIGGAIGGLVNRAFGRKAPEVESRYLTGSVGGSGDFSGNVETNILERGGWFRSDRRSQQFDAVTGDLDKALDEGAKQLVSIAKQYGNALGLPIDELANVSTQIRVELTDDIQENSAAIEDALGQFADALFNSFADEVEPFRLSGETVAQTIERMGSSLLQVNTVLDNLGFEALATSLEGAGSAIALQQAFGGQGNLDSLSQNYYEKFYTEQEKAARSTDLMTKALESVNLTMPTTRAEFKALVSDAASNLDSEAGRNSFVVLMQIASAFDTLYPAAQDATESVEDLAKKMEEIAAKRFDLQVELLRAQGNELGAVALERQNELDALRKLDPALADLQQAIYDTKDSAEAAAEAQRELERAQRVTAGADRIVGDFLSGQDLINNKATRIQEILAEGGIESSIPGIIGSTRQDIINLWNSVGTAGREAILSAYDLWVGMDDLINGTLRKVAEYRGGSLATSIEKARLAEMTPVDRISYLKNKEANLFARLPTAENPVEVAQELQGVIIDRIKEESDLRDAERDATREAAEEQIRNMERLRSLSDDIGQFVGSLKFSELSPLAPRDQVSAAKQLFDSTYQKAMSGDAFAQSNLLTNAKAYIEEGVSAYASGPQAAEIFNYVTGMLETLQQSIGVSLTDPNTAAAEAQATSLPAIETYTGDMLEKLISIDTILAAWGRPIPLANSTTSGLTSVSDAVGGVTTVTNAGTSATSTVTAAATASPQTNAQLTSMIEQLESVSQNSTALNALIENFLSLSITVDREGFLQMLAAAAVTNENLAKIYEKLRNPVPA